MKKIIVLKGLPASGKSSWAKETVKKEPHKYLRINKDDLRQMLFGQDFNIKNEREVLDIRDNFIMYGLEKNKTVIVDDTNLNPIHEANIKQIAENNNCKWEVKFFDVPIEECIERDSKRIGMAKVGEKVITEMYDKYLKVKEIKQQDHLPLAIIVDLDGTLAINNTGRSFYDEAKAIDDDCNIKVKSLITLFQANSPNLKTIIVSGRAVDRGLKATTDWLERFSIHYDELFLRGVRDTRPDSIIKKEIYEAYIENKYNVYLVLDDRNSVVSMWRKLGLTCFQVADGNF